MRQQAAAVHSPVCILSMTISRWLWLLLCLWERNQMQNTEQSAETRQHTVEPGVHLQSIIEQQRQRGIFYCVVFLL